MIYNDKMAQGITSPECREKEKKPCCGLNVRVFALILLCLVGILSPGVSGAQTSSNEAEWSGEGYSIKKVVSNTSIASGVNFSYTILFSAPAGVTTVSIQDLVPVPPLTIVSVTAAGPVLGVSPVIGFSNITGQVTYNLTSLPVNLGPPSGSFTIVVKFPEGVTCNGATARNRAEILVNDKWQGTPFVSTTATAVDPWVAGKTILSGAVVNPNGGTCGYLMNPGDTITYRLSVMKANGYYGNTVGQQNMTNAVVTDNLPAGASMVPTTNPCITYSGGTGGTITWNVNCPSQLLDAAVPWAYYFVDVKVVYPAAAFPVSSQVLNQVTLTGTTCNQQATHISNQTCIEVANVQPNAQATFQKYLSMTNRVPGCTGLYYIVFCNNGNVPLTAFDINDAVPSGITVNQVQIWGTNSTTTMDLNINNTPYATGINNYYNSGSIPSGVTNLQFQMTGSLPVGACLYLYVYFTVNPNPTGTIVTNCATFTPLSNALTLPQTCVSFTVDAGTPSPCLLKDICSPQSSYDPGDIVRFRLRVQNIGSANLTGASIQDLLHGNFTYVGNETYYQSSSYNPSCSTGGNPPAGATAWSGVTPSHSGNNLSWSLPVIPSDCQLFYAAYCGYYGTWGLPFYYIEFDAMVDSLAMPGVTPNVYTISGGNLVSPVQSNTVNILVAASFGQEVHKLLSTDNGASYASSGITTPGSTARFRLNYKNTSNVGVSSLRLVDLLALDASPGDKLILNRSINRGSQFDLSYTGNQATSLLPPGPAPTPSLFWASGEDICLPPYVVSSCATTSWGPTVDSNVRMDYGAFTLAPNLNLYEDFDVGIPVTAKNQEKVCNDFAAVASANFLLNGNPQTVTLTPVAAAPVCLTIDTAQVSVSCCDSIRIERAPGGDGVIGCCARMTATCPVDSVTISVSNGTIVSINSNCGPLPSGYAGQSTFTFATNGCIPDITTCVNPGQTGTVALNYHLVFSNGEKCDKRIILDCEAGTSHCCDSIRLEPAVSADGTDACCAKLTTTCEVKSIDVSVTNGTLASVSWNCSTPLPSGYAGQSSFTFAPGGCAVEMTTCVTPTQTGIVVINYVITFTNGEKCEKRIELDCKAVSCCDSIRLEPAVSADGTDACCAKLTTTCEVKSIDVSVTNGTLASVSWNCSTPLPSGYAGQSSFTFAPGGCAVEMTTCVTPTQTGIVVINYIITFTNGEKCEKRIELDCKAVSCCDSIRLEPAVSADGTDACCAKLTTTCEVKSIDVSVTNGTLASVSWNCSTPLPSGYAGQSSFTFAPGGCAVEMTACVTPTQTGIVVINYVITFTNGEKCEKRIELDCKAVSCCENVKLTAVGDAEECCARLVTDCEVKSVEVKITNGTIGSAGWNCGPLPSGYAGQSSFTFTPGNCVLDLKLCVKPLQTGPVTISYFITFANGETCEKSITLDCTVTSTCCAVMDFKLKTKWPSWKTQIGSFHVVNADPTVSICYIEIYPSPAGTFTPGGLMVNGSPSAQSWTPARIPATGNFSQTSVNTVDFNLTATQYKGVITVCVVKCDGTRCCFDFKWNNGLVADVEIGIDKGSGNSGLKALSISPVVKTPIEGKIRYISFGFTDEKEIAEGTSEFFAISAASHDGDEYPADLEPVASGYMGRHMVFFELKEARNAAENFGRFNLVFRGILPKLGATLFDEEGNIIYSGTIAIPGADTLTSSLTIETENAQGMMFEFMNVYPNPSNGSFKLAYATGTPREVEVRLVTTTGQVLFSKLNPEKKAGIHHLTIDAGAISSGLYKVLLISEGETRSKSLVIQQR